MQKPGQSILNMNMLKINTPLPLNSKAIGLRIKNARRSRNWKQKKLGQVMLVKTKTVSSWEGGWRIPERDTLIKLSYYLRRSLEWILFGSENRTVIWNRKQ